MLGCACTHVPTDVMNGGMGDIDLSFPAGTPSYSNYDLGISNIGNSGGSGFNWGSILNTGFNTGFRLAENVFSDKPSYQSIKDPNGRSSVTMYGNNPGGITDLSGGLSVPSLGTIAIIGLGVWGLSAIFGKK